ncbi:MAG: tryptophan-rich sensory protein [Clostridia bacterium]|nr:tryptophan-rich sensory protein [Clostridia bacterium]
MDKVKIYFKSILIPVLVGAVVGLIISPSMDYNSLQKPFLAPPGIVFPIVWTILYILMGISYGILKVNKSTDQNIDSIYYAQLTVNALWSIFFFTLKWRLFSFIWILLLAILVIIMIIRFYNKNKVAGLLQIPYLLWVLFASYLNISFYILNR